MLAFLPVSKDRTNKLHIFQQYSYIQRSLWDKIMTSPTQTVMIASSISTFLFIFCKNRPIIRGILNKRDESRTHLDELQEFLYEVHVHC